MWVAKFDHEASSIVDEGTGQCIAEVFRDGAHPAEQWSRACVMAAAPTLYTALADLITHCKRNFPPGVLSERVKEYEDILRKVKDDYERHPSLFHGA